MKGTKRKGSLKKLLNRKIDTMLEGTLWLIGLIVFELLKFKASYHVLKWLGWLGGFGD